LVAKKKGEQAEEGSENKMRIGRTSKTCRARGVTRKNCQEGGGGGKENRMLGEENRLNGPHRGPFQAKEQNQKDPVRKVKERKAKTAGGFNMKGGLWGWGGGGWRCVGGVWCWVVRKTVLGRRTSDRRCLARRGLAK